MSLRDRVCASVASVFDADVESITDKTSPEDLMQWDSLGHMRVITALEETFAVQYELDEIMEATSVGTIIEQLRGKGCADE